MPGVSAGDESLFDEGIKVSPDSGRSHVELASKVSRSCRTSSQNRANDPLPGAPLVSNLEFHNVSVALFSAGFNFSRPMSGFRVSQSP
jgi:hypothetical protein